MTSLTSSAHVQRYRLGPIDTNRHAFGELFPMDRANAYPRKTLAYVVGPMANLALI